ncbi:ABC transporter ATP-binding protein [Catonella massiliensis]|uniref:ABC transporter ATP-binding protein n=1 Tax=Catonella massiliensis TaxID=2799636 RepID=A0ABS1J2N1_9FIRM|nr:ABC transporter ATP-binding protein [Catonella massiliensis]MBK5898413.1 ABC transporter ATP-binding protein [Catonella massiliensis]
MIKLFRYLRKKDWLFVCISLCFIVFQVWLDLRLPDYMAEITRLIQTPDSALSSVVWAGMKMLACAILSMAAMFVVGYFVAQVAAGLSKRLREAVYDKVISFSMEEMGKFSTASLITRSTNDISQVQMVIAIGLQASVRAPIMAVWAITKIINKNLMWSAATGVAVAFLLVLIAVIFVLVVPGFQKMQTLTDNINRVARENLSGVRVVRAYNAEKYQEDKFEEANEELTSVNLFNQKIMALMSPVMTLISSGLTLSIYWIGVYLIDKAALQDKITLFSDMIVFSSYAMQVIMSFMMLTFTFIILPRAIVSSKRINEVLDTKNRIMDGEGCENTSETGTVEFRNVSFHYPDAADDIISDINFKANKGEMVAFIGATGSGKTTLINLIPRFYDVTGGEVLVDGVNVKKYKLSELRKKIGYAPQKALLFSGTVEENVCYGADTPDSERLNEALEISQAKEFVEKLTDNVKSKISQGAVNVSGGQKQRLSIARSLYNKPEILIFDDSFSALDYRTDKILRKELRERSKGSTSLIVAQRIGTIMEADLIIVLEEGRIVGQGKHKELLKSCPIYKEIAMSQLSEEEL